ncbi:MAG: hypothetical protein ACLVJ6_08250 [Merdibacter sp.]
MPVHILKCAIGEYAGDKEDLYEEILEYACRIIVANMHIIHDGGFRLTVHKDDSFHRRRTGDHGPHCDRQQRIHGSRTLVFTDNTAQIDLEGLPLDCIRSL